MPRTINSPAMKRIVANRGVLCLGGYISAGHSNQSVNRAKGNAVSRLSPCLIDRKILSQLKAAPISRCPTYSASLGPSGHRFRRKNGEQAQRRYPDRLGAGAERHNDSGVAECGKIA